MSTENKKLSGLELHKTILSIVKTLSGGASIYPSVKILENIVAGKSSDVNGDLVKVKEMLLKTNQPTFGKNRNREIVVSLINDEIGIVDETKVVIENVETESKVENKTTDDSDVEQAKTNDDVTIGDVNGDGGDTQPNGSTDKNDESTSEDESKDVTEDATDDADEEIENESNSVVESTESEVEGTETEDEEIETIEVVEVNPTPYIVEDDFYDANIDILNDLGVEIGDEIFIDEDESLIVSTDEDGTYLEKFIPYIKP